MGAAEAATRASAGSGDNTLIAGFVVPAGASKRVLVRAVGPTLGAAPFNVITALATPKLELFRGTTSLQVNTGIAANRSAVDAAAQQSGAFPLAAAGTDAAIVTTLAPGNYTAVVSSTSSSAGVASQVTRPGAPRPEKPALISLPAITLSSAPSASPARRWMCWGAHSAPNSVTSGGSPW